MTEEEVNRQLANFSVPLERRRLSLENVEWLVNNIHLRNADCGAMVSTLREFHKELSGQVVIEANKP